MYIDLKQVRRHIEFNEGVRNRHSIFNGIHCMNVLDHVIFFSFFSQKDSLPAESESEREVTYGQVW